MEGLHQQTEQNNESEFEIGSVEGLRRFSEYVDEAYRAVMAGADSAPGSAQFNRGKAAYEKITALIKTSESDLQNGVEVSDAAIEELQSLYDEMWTVADELAGEVPAATEAPTEPAVIPDESPETMSGEVMIEEAEGVAPIPDEKMYTPEEMERALEMIRAVAVRATHLVDEYKEPVNQHPDSGTFNAAAYYYQELTQAAVRIEAIANTLTRERDQNKMDALEFKHFTDKISEAEENLDQLETGLKRVLFGEAAPPEAANYNPMEEATPEAVVSNDETESAVVAPEDTEEPEEVSKPRTGALKVGTEETDTATITITTPPKPEPVVEQPVAARAPAPRLRELRSTHERGALTSSLAPLITNALREQRYRSFVEQAFGSPSDFEVSLLRRIAVVEAPSKLDTVLGINHDSAFNDLLKDMTIAEVEQFDRLPREQLRAALTEKNIEYEAYVQWLEGFYAMLQILRVPVAMTFGELFVRAEIEELMHHYYPQKKV